jgi:ferritin
MPTATPFTQQLNEQVANEFAAHQQYVACAVYYESETLPQLAHFFYRQALEERDHAMMMVQYLLDTDAEVIVPGVSAPRVGFADVVEPVAISLEQEQRVSMQISALAATAREQTDYAAEQFMQWFIAEQIEEVATMSDLLAVATRSRDRVMEIEDFIAREHSGGEGSPPAQPRVAGAAD